MKALIFVVLALTFGAPVAWATPITVTAAVGRATARDPVQMSDGTSQTVASLLIGSGSSLGTTTRSVSLGSWDVTFGNDTWFGSSHDGPRRLGLLAISEEAVRRVTHYGLSPGVAPDVITLAATDPRLFAQASGWTVDSLSYRMLDELQPINAGNPIVETARTALTSNDAAPGGADPGQNSSDSGSQPPPSPAPLPEPASMVLLGTGLFCLAAVARRLSRVSTAAPLRPALAFPRRTEDGRPRPRDSSTSLWPSGSSVVALQPLGPSAIARAAQPGGVHRRRLGGTLARSLTPTGLAGGHTR
jgi:hypothetical protein